MINLLLAINGKQRWRRRRTVARANKPSRRAEAAYRDELLKVVAELKRLSAAYLLPVLQRLEPQYAKMQKDGAAADILQAFDLMAVRMGGLLALADRMAMVAALRARDDVDKSLAQGIGRSLGIDALVMIKTLNVRPQIESAVAMNTQLIKSVPTQFMDKVKSKVLLNIQQGRRYTEIANEIQGELDTTARRAKLIARDQTAKMQAAITEAKQKALGIESYVWETAGDERVRDSHRAKDGKEFRWDSPPSDTGHPGDDINCRCVARPVIKFEDD